MKPPSASAFADALGGALFVPAGDQYRVTAGGWGWSENAPNHLHLRCEGGSTGQIEVTARTHAPMSDHMLVHRLLFRSIGHGKIAMPLEVRVERVKIRVRLDGRSRVLSALTSGSRAIAVVKVGDLTLEIEGKRADLEGLVLRRVTKKELKALVRDKRAEHARLEKQRKRRR